MGIELFYDFFENFLIGLLSSVAAFDLNADVLPGDKEAIDIWRPFDSIGDPSSFTERIVSIGNTSFISEKSPDRVSFTPKKDKCFSNDSFMFFLTTLSFDGGTQEAYLSSLVLGTLDRQSLLHRFQLHGSKRTLACIRVFLQVLSVFG